jgi:prepilin-type N-terminal cleavage/methylation domain-containing protein
MIKRDVPCTNRVGRRGFSLVELLVAIFIIVLIAGILLPMVTRSFRQSSRLRTQGDFQAIASALEAYKADFGDIPRLPVNGAGISGPNTGAAVLGKALLGTYGVTTSIQPFSSGTKYNVGECVGVPGAYFVCIADVPAGTATADTKSWAPFDPTDGANGPGFKTRGGAGKTWGPYIDPGKFNSKGSILLDSAGRPILYFPAKTGQLNVTDTATPVYTGLGQTFKYNLADNFEFFRRPSDSPDLEIQHRMQVMLNDADLNGAVSSSPIAEVEIAQPYLLWASGPDELFGPAGEVQTNGAYLFNPAKPEDNRKMAGDCDDVTNFR